MTHICFYQIVLPTKVRASDLELLLIIDQSHQLISEEQLSWAHKHSLREIQNQHACKNIHYLLEFHQIIGNYFINLIQAPAFL